MLCLRDADKLKKVLLLMFYSPVSGMLLLFIDEGVSEISNIRVAVQTQRLIKMYRRCAALKMQKGPTWGPV